MKIVLEIDDELRRLLLRVALAHDPESSNGAQSAAHGQRCRRPTCRKPEQGLWAHIQRPNRVFGNGSPAAVSPAALAKFIASPAGPGRLPNQPTLRPSPVSPPSRSPSSAAKTPKQRRPRIQPEIDLMPKAAVQETGPELTDDEWEQIFGQKEHGWPADVVEQVRRDRKEGITRTYVLRVGDAARYLGLSRGRLDKLISAGKLRISTIRSPYRAEKPAKLIPAKDVLALK